MRCYSADVLEIRLSNMMNENTKTLLKDESTDVLEAIAESIRLVKEQTGYGSIEITVHDGRVTQIERSEKVRFEQRKKS